MKNCIEKVATENAKTIIDSMVKNFVNDFYGNEENVLTLDKVDSYLEFVRELLTTPHRDFENDLLGIMSNNLYCLSVYVNTLYNWEIMPMAMVIDEDLKKAFEDGVNYAMDNIKYTIQRYITERDKITEGVA